MTRGLELRERVLARHADSEVHRVLVDGDLVGVHSRQRDDAAIDIYRFDGDEVVEHVAIRRPLRPVEPGKRDEFEGADGVAGDQDEARRAANRDVVDRMQHMLFVELRVDEAMDRFFAGEHYLQHAPGAPDGIAFIREGFRKRFADHPEATSRLHHIIADGDLVMTHRRSRLGPDAPLRIIGDVFRVEDGRIVEHWDVTQEA